MVLFGILSYPSRRSSSPVQLVGFGLFSSPFGICPEGGSEIFSSRKMLGPFAIRTPTHPLSVFSPSGRRRPFHSFHFRMDL